MYVMERMESADASLVSNKLPFGFADRNETSLSIHEVFTSHPRMTDTFQHSHMSRWFSSGPDCVEVNNSDHV